VNHCCNKRTILRDWGGALKADREKEQLLPNNGDEKNKRTGREVVQTTRRERVTGNKFVTPGLKKFVIFWNNEKKKHKKKRVYGLTAKKVGGTTPTVREHMRVRRDSRKEGTPGNRVNNWVAEVISAPRCIPWCHHIQKLQ